MGHISKHVITSGTAVHARGACTSVWRVLLPVCSFRVLAISPPFGDSIVHRKCDYLPKWDTISMPVASLPPLVLAPARTHPCVTDASNSPAISHIWSIPLWEHALPLGLSSFFKSNFNPFLTSGARESQGSVPDLSSSTPSRGDCTESCGFQHHPYTSASQTCVDSLSPSNSRALHPSLRVTSLMKWVKYFSNWT